MDNWQQDSCWNQPTVLLKVPHLQDLEERFVEALERIRWSQNSVVLETSGFTMCWAWKRFFFPWEIPPKPKLEAWRHGWRRRSLNSPAEKQESCYWLNFRGWYFPLKNERLVHLKITTYNWKGRIESSKAPFLGSMLIFGGVTHFFPKKYLMCWLNCWCVDVAKKIFRNDRCFCVDFFQVWHRRLEQLRVGNL